MAQQGQPAGAAVAWDPELIRRWSRVFDGIANVFSPRVIGAENVPESGPALVVGNHSLLWPVEVWIAGRAIFERRGLEAPLVGLGYDLLFAVPGLGNELRRFGVVPAARSAGESALRREELVMVYPGGDLDACRPATLRDRVEFGGHRGFVRLALRSGAPVVPLVSHGGSHSTLILARGDRLARMMRLEALRVHVFPIFVGPPLGVETVFTPPLPLPAAITTQFLPPIDWSRYGAEAASDPEVVDACYHQITAAMQEALDGLAAEDPHPVVTATRRLAAMPLRKAAAAFRLRT